MSVDIDDTTIITFKGDECTVTFTNLDEGIIIGFQVRERNTNKPVFEPLEETVNSEGEVTFTITSEMTNKFKVKPFYGVNSYLYGIKDMSGKNTILLGENPKFSDLYEIKVYLKKVD